MLRKAETDNSQKYSTKDTMASRDKKQNHSPLKKARLPAPALLLSLCLLLSGCSASDEDAQSSEASVSLEESSAEAEETETEEAAEDSADSEGASAEEESSDTDAGSESESYSADLSDIPEYSGDPYVVIDDNVPDFSEEDMTTESFETYSELDSLGRCGEAYADIGEDLMPTGERESISEVTPSGWQSVQYDSVDGGYLYNRCHLIGYQLTAENANEENLITGTRYLNVEGMLPFENLVADYIEETGNHVLYRVTPLFEGDDLVARGVQMEAYSVEDDGDGVEFNVFCYNVQPGIEIDYATGDSWEEGGSDTESSSSADAESDSSDSSSGSSSSDTEATYILNTNTMKFHDPDCSSVSQMSESNKVEYTGSREDLISEGYSPCGNCNP